MKLSNLDFYILLIINNELEFTREDDIAPREREIDRSFKHLWYLDLIKANTSFKYNSEMTLKGKWVLFLRQKKLYDFK